MSRTCLLLLLIATLPGCGTTPAPKSTLRLATTTSTQDTGLLDELLPAFERQSGVHVDAVAVGSGQALQLGRRGDADVLLTHSPKAEDEFEQAGFAASRHRVMYNDFILAGPAADPAGVAEMKEIAVAFQKIEQAQQPFVSRGDESGTHQKERSIWATAKRKPEGKWYIEAGTGMASALRMAHEKQAYVLCDRATWLSLRKELTLKILFEGGTQLKNIYAVNVVSRQKHPSVKQDEATRFSEYLRSPEGQELIGRFGVEKYGQALFVPDASSP